MIASLGVNVITLSYQLGGYVKEPVTLVEKSRVPRRQCRGLSDLCCFWSGWER